MTEVTERRICWPEFDATCLEGGCMYCDDNPFRKLTAIRRAAEKLGQTHNRGNGTPADAIEAYERGWRNRWYNRIEVR